MKTINAFVFFKWSFVEIETNIWHAPSTRKSNFTSRTFFRCFFFLPLFSYSFFLGKTDSYRKLLLSSFLAFSPFFRSGFTRCRVFLSLRRRRKRTIRVDWTFGSQTMEIKIMKNRFSWLWVLKQNCFIFLRLNASKKLDIAQNPSRKVLLDHYRQDNKWRLRS